MTNHMTIPNLQAWSDFWAVNCEVLADEVGDEATCLNLATCGKLMVGGGAAELFVITYLGDGETPERAPALRTDGIVRIGRDRNAQGEPLVVVGDCIAGTVSDIRMICEEFETVAKVTQTTRAI